MSSLFRLFLTKRTTFFLLSIFLFGFCHNNQAAFSTFPSTLEQLPIQEGGRRKPYFVFAEETLRALSGKTAVILNGKKREALDLITSCWLEPELPWPTEPLILISHRLLKETLHLPAQQKLFSYDTLSHNKRLHQFITEATAERKRDPRKRLQGLQKEASDVALRLALFEELHDGSLFRIVPNPEGRGTRWSSLSEWEQLGTPGDPDAGEEAFKRLQQGWTEGNAPLFGEAATQLQGLLEPLDPTPIASWKLALEVHYQHAHLFRWAWILYAIAGLLLFSSQGIATSQEKVNPSKKTSKPLAYHLSWFFAGSGFFFQAMGLLARVLIAGRPPVTNMYESIIWVAFGTIFFALMFETLFHSGLFLLGAIPVAVASLILADSQPMILDPSIHPLTPVLRDNFWLTIHVLTITLSYAAFALSLGVAHVILIRIILRHKVSPTLYNYLYRTLQVGVLLLATGTILGGIWANYSWGRFWDWDPKETWALIALLGYLFLLHGRIAGRWGGFGLAIGSVIAFLSVLMAWYGVNFVLGAGLHSYGFGTGGFPLVITFVSLETLLLIAAVVCKKRRN